MHRYEPIRANPQQVRSYPRQIHRLVIGPTWIAPETRNCALTGARRRGSLMQEHSTVKSDARPKSMNGNTPSQGQSANKRGGGRMPGWILGVIALILMAGGLILTQRTQVRRTACLTVWRSPESTVQQRAEAVNRLIPPGTTASAVWSILGSPDEGVYIHGRVRDLDRPTTQPDPIEEVALIRDAYCFPDGMVCLYFKPPSATNLVGAQFSHVTWEPLQH